MAAEKKNLPAYLSFPTFRGFIESLHKTVIPDHIHKSLMPTLSNGVQSHLMVALRFLALITGPDNAATPALRDLVDTFGNETKWPIALGKVVTTAYKPILGTLDVSKAAVGTLEDAFRKATSLDGLMLERAMRFYIKAAKESNLPLSPHISNRKPRMPVRKAVSKTARPAAGDASRSSKNEEPPSTDDPPSAGMIQVPLLFHGKPAGKVVVPANIGADDMRVIELMIPQIRAYLGIKEPAKAGT